jgi:hypothetical protein
MADDPEFTIQKGVAKSRPVLKPGYLVAAAMYD